MIIETNIYFAKATFPVGNDWKSGWLTKEAAIEKARWFVRSWLADGSDHHKATVFYRDGSVVLHVDARNCFPETDIACRS